MSPEPTRDAESVVPLAPKTLAEQVAVIETENERLQELVYRQAGEICRLRDEVERLRRDTNGLLGPSEGGRLIDGGGA